MTAQLLSSDLTALIQDSKRKNPDVRAAADKSLSELKALPHTSEAQLVADLRRRPNFVRPFLLSCASKTPKLASTSVSSLQRLIVSGALAKETLKDVLDVLRDCTGLSQDIQLKILQILPALLQNYASHLAGDLLATALHICFLLFASKTAVITNTAAATLQQLAVSAFGKAAQEDELSGEHDVVAEVPVEDGTVSVRSAALDAYRLLNDICLLTEGHSPTFLHPASMPQNFGLEILEAILSNYPEIISSHPELIHVIRIRLMPFIIRVLSERVMFSTTVRSIRLLPLIFGNLLSVLSSECEMVLSLLNHMLDPDASVLWKRVLCMEVFRGLHAEATLVRSIYGLYDEQEGKRNIVQDHLGILVRLASEKPAIIGLGQQSSVPASSGQAEDNLDDMAALQADGVAGTFGVAMTLRASTAPGISTRLSTMRVPCLDQLDKNEPPPLPPAYLYTLALTCLNSFAEGLARFLLPFTVPGDSRPKRRPKQNLAENDPDTPDLEDPDDEEDEERRPQPKRATSSATPTRVPVNPLALSDHVLYDQIETSASMAEACWPALLAAYSTFFHAALDSEYFHALVRSFQKFTQISGLLRLSTPRDAFLTTLGKNAVPSGLIAAPSPSHDTPPADVRDTRGGIRTTKKEPAGTPRSAATDKGRRSLEVSRASLNTRNLLCLRALLHLRIALGPVLGSAWSIVLETLQAADVIIHHITSQKRPTRSSQTSGSSDTDILGDIGNEIAAVRVAASRMFESSGDLPDRAFLDIVRSLCGLLKYSGQSVPSTESGTTSTPTPKTHTPKNSISSSLVTAQNTDPRANVFVIESLEKMVDSNPERLLARMPRDSGWQIVVEPMIDIVSSKTADRYLRTRASHLACILVELTASSSIDADVKSPTRQAGLQALETLISTLDAPASEDKASRACEIEIQNEALETLHSTLERYGDTLIEGWEAVFAVVSSVFCETAAGAHVEATTSSESMSTTARSPKLVRSSFACLQLVCSDFLAAVPSECLGKLLRTTYQFCRQQEDFNIALTSTSLFNSISDQALQTNLEQNRGQDDTMTNDRTDSDELLGLLLLLVRVTADTRAEIRQSAIHSLFGILRACSTRISAQHWMRVQTRVVLRLFSSNVDQYRTSLGSRESNDGISPNGLDDAVVLILDKTADLFTSHAHVMVREDSFEPFWSELVSHLRDFLGRGDLKISGAVYAALEHVLSNIGQQISRRTATSVLLVWELWHEANPADHRNTSQTDRGNERALLAYLRCFSALYPLVVSQVNSAKLRSMLRELWHCAVKSTISAPREDLDRMTSVQSDILTCIGAIDPTTRGFASELLRCISSLIELPQQRPSNVEPSVRPTFVAFSRAAMDILADLVDKCSHNEEVYSDGSFVAAIKALNALMSQKYQAGLESKGRPLWQKATETFVRVVRRSLPVLIEIEFEDTTNAPLWEEALACLQSVASADLGHEDEAKDLSADQDFDMEAFEALYALIMPALGREMVSDRLRRSFAASVFQNSLIHEPHPDDMPESGDDPLGNLHSTHIGRVRRLPPSPRSRMCYVLFDKLFDLVARHDGSEERVRLAQAAAPFLILRTSLVLKAYVFNQPLRGRMPVAASQRKELLYTLDRLVRLDCEPRAIPASHARPATSRTHLHWVYGLVVQALSVAQRDPGLHAALTRVLDAASAASVE